VIVEDPRPARESASPLLLIHGFLGEPADWDAVVADLGVPRRTLRANLPLHGREHADLASLADALADAIRASGLAPISAVGYSLGGRVLLTLARRHPLVLRRGIAVSATPGLRDAEERAARTAADAALADALLREGIGPFLDRWYAQPLFASLRSHPDFALVARRRSARASDARDAAAWSAILRDASPGANPHLWDELEALSAGISFAVGRLDAKYLAIAHEIERVAPSVGIEFVEGAGHAIHLERPGTLAASIDRLLD
jgi:2-succinyl-6-hydroxy-2,4-cyclohexadiene-1-carboxylate synthase